MCADERMLCSLNIRYIVHITRTTWRSDVYKTSMVFSIGFFCSHSVHNVTLRRIQNLNGFSIGFFCSHSVHNVTLRRIQNLNGFLYRIFLFTLRAQRDAPTYTKLKWLFYRIFLFTLRAQHDAPTYTKTTDQCGARSGSPQ